MKMRKKILIGCAGVLMSLSLAACGNKTVATTNGGKITQNQYYNEMKQTASGHAILQQMILDRLLNKQYGSSVSKTKVNSLINQMKTQEGSSFNLYLQQQGLTVPTLKRRLRNNLLLNEAVKHNIRYTTPMIKKQFKKFEPNSTVEHISVKSQAKAQNIESKLKSGSSFSSLVKKGNGGTLTLNNTAQVDKSFKKAAFKLSNGEYTKSPVKTQNGYEIIKMIDKPAKGTYKDHLSQLETQIADRKMKNSSLVRKIVRKVLRKGSVNIQDPDLKNILANYMS